MSKNLAKKSFEKSVQKSVKKYFEKSVQIICQKVIQKIFFYKYVKKSVKKSARKNNQKVCPENFQKYLSKNCQKICKKFFQKKNCQKSFKKSVKKCFENQSCRKLNISLGDVSLLSEPKRSSIVTSDIGLSEEHPPNSWFCKVLVTIGGLRQNSKFAIGLSNFSSLSFCSMFSFIGVFLDNMMTGFNSLVFRPLNFSKNLSVPSLR